MNNEHSAVARLGAESLRQTKDGLRKERQTPAVHDFNTQSHRLALEGPQRQDSAKPTHREWNAPPPNRERDSQAGTRLKQRYDRWDGPRGLQRSPDDTGISHGTKQALVISQWERSWNQPSSFGNSREKSSWEFNGNSKGERQTHPGAISPRNRRKNSPRFQTDQAQTESTQEQKTPPYFDSQKLMEMMMKEFFQRKEEVQKWEKKDKPDSA